MLTDIHTHILPHMDDGAENVDVSLAMLKEEAMQGVASVVLTPHYYPRSESREQFLSRREESYRDLLSAVEKLPKQEKDQLPQLMLGAEVAWASSLLEDDMRTLCIGSTRTLLLEMPTQTWTQKMINQIYDLQMRQGVLPVFAHFDRYVFSQSKELVEQIFDMNLPIQLGTEPFLDLFARRKALNMIRRGYGHLIASDCHNMDQRKPNLQKAMHVVEKHLGIETVETLCSYAQNLTEG